MVIARGKRGGRGWSVDVLRPGGVFSGFWVVARFFKPRGGVSYLVSTDNTIFNVEVIRG